MIGRISTSIQTKQAPAPFRFLDRTDVAPAAWGEFGDACPASISFAVDYNRNCRLNRPGTGRHR
jgi:hypothetical protein